MKGKVTRESIAKGPKSLWRYKDLLPVSTPKVGFHSGFTPLKKMVFICERVKLNFLE